MSSNSIDISDEIVKWDLEITYINLISIEKVYNTSCSRARRAEFENRGPRPQKLLWALWRLRKVRK